MVVRRSGFICPRTIAIRANKAARDLSRSLIKALRDPGTEVIVRLEVL